MCRGFFTQVKNAVRYVSHFFLCALESLLKLKRKLDFQVLPEPSYAYKAQAHRFSAKINEMSLK